MDAELDTQSEFQSGTTQQDSSGWPGDGVPYVMVSLANHDIRNTGGRPPHNP